MGKSRRLSQELSQLGASGCILCVMRMIIVRQGQRSWAVINYLVSGVAHETLCLCWKQRKIIDFEVASFGRGGFFLINNYTIMRSFAATPLRPSAHS